ncbi:MAG: hypothetical protein V3U73_01690 [bacterium]
MGIECEYKYYFPDKLLMHRMNSSLLKTNPGVLEAPGFQAKIPA